MSPPPLLSDPTVRTYRSGFVRCDSPNLRLALRRRSIGHAFTSSKSRACNAAQIRRPVHPFPPVDTVAAPAREPCGSPPSSVLWNRKTAQLPLPAPPVSLGDRFSSFEGLFASLGESLVPHGTWFLWVGRNRAQMSGEVVSSPGFTESPLISMPRASDSGDSEHTSHNGAPDAAFRAANGVGIAMRSISELNPRGLLTHCVRFAPASHPANGNTRYRPARYGFDRAGLAPAGLQQEVSLTHRSSSSSALIPARSQFDPELSI